MIDHFGINCSDLAAAAAFYDQVLGVLGFTRLMDFGVAIGYGTDKPDFWIGRQPAEGPASGPNREIHVAFARAGRRRGAGVLRRRRGAWAPRCSTSRGSGRSTTTHYYGAFVRDPDGNNVEAVCHTAQPGDDLPAGAGSEPGRPAGTAGGGAAT